MYPDPNASGQQSYYHPSTTNPYPQNPAPPPPPYPNEGPPPQNPAPQMGTHTHSETYIYVRDGNSFGAVPAQVTCPHCHQNTMSKISYTPGVLTWIFFGLCLFFGCWMGCCLIPFCMDSCKDCEHYCSNCNAFLGQYKRL